ncbi:MAG: polysaccharide biosynthesis C-terminal domain-containing protein, partial [Bacteroidales bacterium]|nr:polysaccharide biosynthesis C-terminal domain-containing protein [Bacteroidales bacterium]
MAVAGVPTELGTEKISKLLRQYAVPAIIATTASSLYNMVDSIFIGHGVGKFAIAGLALTFPLMNLGAAFGALVGVGASATISMLLGQRNYEMAQKVLGNVITLNTIIGILYSIVFLVFLDPILYFFGASENTIGFSESYMNIYALGTIFIQLTLGMGAFITAQGFAAMGMVTVLVGAISNIILDPVFIFWLDMGVRGAAVATVLSQALSCAWVMIFLQSKVTHLKLKRKYMQVDFKVVLPCLALGLST